MYTSLRVSEDLLVGMTRRGEGRKLLAFFLLLKARTPCSVRRDWTYSGLAREFGMGRNTVRSRIVALEGLGLVRREERGGVRYLRLGRLHGRHGGVKDGVEVPVGRRSTVSGMRKVLLATAIGIGVDGRFALKQPRKGKLLCSRPNTECGEKRELLYYSRPYSGLAKEFRAGNSTISEALRYGNRRKLFRVVRMRRYVFFRDYVDMWSMQRRHVPFYMLPCGKVVVQYPNVLVPWGLGKVRMKYTRRYRWLQRKQEMERVEAYLNVCRII